MAEQLDPNERYVLLPKDWANFFKDFKLLKVLGEGKIIGYVHEEDTPTRHVAIFAPSSDPQLRIWADECEYATIQNWEDRLVEIGGDLAIFEVSPAEYMRELIAESQTPERVKDRIQAEKNWPV